MMDLLDDILGTLDLRGALYFRTDFSAPWSVRVPELRQAARFHLVVQGACHVTTDGQSFLLGPGDLILIPRGASHALSHEALKEADAPPLERVLEDAGYQGDGALVLGEGDPTASTQLVCGHLTFRQGADHPLLRALPKAFVTSAAARAQQPWLDEVLRLVTRRIFSDPLGAQAAVTRLSEIMFIELLRSGIMKETALVSVLEAFQDDQVGKALQLIHARPADPWTVESLASEVAMSRSRFAERFSTLLGQGPMTYLSDWRLQKALGLLEARQLSVQQIAARSGYASPAAFSRAFSDKFGTAPSSYRRTRIGHS
jgi:AraC-like DNA-binding protein